MKYLFEKFHKIQKKKSLPASHFCYSCRPTANNFSFSYKFFSFSWKSCWFFQRNFFYGTPVRCCFPTVQRFNFSISKLYVIIISRIYTQYLKGIKFRGYLVSRFRDLTIFGKFCSREKFQDQNIAKLYTCRVWDSLLANIWSKYDDDTHILHISTYGNKIRLSVTYLITITLINNRKIVTQ